MGIWIIHSVHFININMEETERAESEREGEWRNGRTDLWVEEILQKQMRVRFRGQNKTQVCKHI